MLVWTSTGRSGVHKTLRIKAMAGRTRVRGQRKIGKVMGEFKRGTLRSGSSRGPKVTNPKQAIAIALSEQRQADKRRRT